LLLPPVNKSATEKKRFIIISNVRIDGLLHFLYSNYVDGDRCSRNFSLFPKENREETEVMEKSLKENFFI
jgi:hypothetical protein